MSAPSVARQTVMIACELIDAPELDARIERDPEKLEELARDILRRGLIEPIKVVVKGARYEAVDGFRRFLATKSAGLAEIECFVYETRTLALEGVKYAANIFREDMSLADEAIMFHELFTTECGNDIERLAALVGKTIGYVDSRLQLLAGDELVFDALKARKIPLGVAQALNEIAKPDYRRHYLGHAISGGSTVAVVRGWVATYKAMYERGDDVDTPPPVAVQPVAAAAIDIHFCEVCRKSDPRHIPIQVQVHQHCKLAVLDVLLESYHSGGGHS